ncbi:Magnetosome formation protease MamE [Azospirillaceae bacterium]
MTFDDIDNDIDPKDEAPKDCARGLRKYLFVMALVVVGTLAGTFWSQSRNGGPYRIGQENAAQQRLGSAMNLPEIGALKPQSQVAAAPIAIPAAFNNVAPGDFATIVLQMRNSVVAIGRMQPDTLLGRNGAASIANDPAAAPNKDVQPTPPIAKLQFADPAAGLVVESIGTGVVARNDGYILTNYHVVRGSNAMMATIFDETGFQRYQAEVIKLDASVDLALLKIKPNAPLTAASFGDSDQVQVAEEVIAIGNPFGLDMTVSRGIVSAKRKSLTIEGTVHRDLLQTDAAINQGNSGGPLVNRFGEVIGINTAIYTPTGAFSGVGFAIPSNQARQFLADELDLPPSRQQMAVAGVTAAIPPVNQAPSTSVGTAGPPILAGVASPHRDGRETMECAICHQLIPRAGNNAITQNKPTSVVAAWPTPGNNTPMVGPPILAGAAPPHRDGRENMACTSCHQFLPRGGAAAVQGKPVAGPLQFAQSPLTLALNVATPGQNTAPDAIGGGFRILGATTLPITASLAQQLNQPEGKGVFVASVAPESPAAKAGLQSGAVIEKVNGQRVRSPRDMFVAIQKLKEGETARLSVFQNNTRNELQLIIAALPAGAGVQPATPLAPKVPTEFNWRGMEIETFASVTLAGAPPNLKGAVVAEVVAGSPAQRVGIMAGDIIMDVGGLATGTAATMNQAIQATTGKTNILVRAVRNNREFFVVMP